MKKKIEYYPKGTTVYYFSGLELMLKETIVENIAVTIDEAGDPAIVYTVDSGRKSVPSLKVDSSHVFCDRETLKAKVLANFGAKEKAQVIKAEVTPDKRLE